MQVVGTQQGSAATCRGEGVFSFGSLHASIRLFLRIINVLHVAQHHLHNNKKYYYQRKIYLSVCTGIDM